jgi:hypothetical protein
MAVILVSAIGLAAIRNANSLWAGMMLLTALAVVGIAVMGAVILRGKERYWWAGFAFFGGAYLAIAVGPWLSPWFQPLLGTTDLLRYSYDRMNPSEGPPLNDAELAAFDSRRSALVQHLERITGIARNAHDPAIVVLRRQLARLDAELAASKNSGPLYEHFQSVGHSLFTLLAGLVGGTVAVWFYARRERQEREGSGNLA